MSAEVGADAATGALAAEISEVGADAATGALAGEISEVGADHTSPAPRRREVDLQGALPTGLHALEASAGTGKTYALSALALRYVAEQGVTASQLCIVSFTIPATAELRGRIRSRLAQAALHLESTPGVEPDDAQLAGADLVLAHLGRCDDDERHRRIARLRAAVADFDAATIATIHGFCARVLASLGDGADSETAADGSTDVAEVVSDVLLAHHLAGGEVPNAPHRLVTGVEAMLRMPDAAWFLGDPQKRATATRPADDAAVALAVRLMTTCRDEVLARRQRSRRRTFDGLLSETRDLLAGPDGAAAMRALRDRYRVVLIDEFQDTDRVQWDIFRRAFVDECAGDGAGDGAGDDPGFDPGGDSGETPAVVIVGDPKQSIYRFRSAELSAYLDAVSAAGDRSATLATNWRSDGPLLAGLDHLLDGFTFGDPTVSYRPVAAAHDAARLTGDGAPVQIRCIERDHEGDLTVPTARRMVRSDVITVVSELLDGSSTLPVEGSDTHDRRPLRPGDIAILTRSNAEASSLALALAGAGIPAATAASSSVLDSDAARQWEVLLEALQRPGSPGAVRAAALGWFVGREPAEIAELTDDQAGALHDQMRAWSDVLAHRGIPGLLAAVRGTGLHRRLLARPGGARDLTDVDHVAEILQSITGGRPVPATTLLGALADASEDPEGVLLASDALARRIDRDDDAVQVVTMHKSKGLEFPVVLCPFLWTNVNVPGQVPHAFENGRRWLDATWVAGVDRSRVIAKRFGKLASAEASQESRRLLYVAMTRARHRCIVWWAPVTSSRRRGALGEVFDEVHGHEAESVQRLADLVERSGRTISVHPVPQHRPRSATDLAATSTDRTPGADPTGGIDRAVDASSDAPPALSAAVATRVLDRSWRIWSFSAVAAAARSRVEGARSAIDDATHPSPAETIVGHGEDEAGPVPGLADEQSPGVERSFESGLGAVADEQPGAAAARSPLAGAPSGTTFGTLVHELFEHCDFQADPLVDHLTTLCVEALRYRPHPISPADLAAGIAHAIESPLGGPLGARRLRDVSLADRLDEVDFHLPLGRLRADDIGRTLVEHLGPDDPMLPWAERLADGPTSGFDLDLDGRLTGSIDLFARSPHPSGSGHLYWVADYKSNQLGEQSIYVQRELIEAMGHHDYLLQATLYLVAAHRYLRWRLPGYRPDLHLGGAAYLFVRGMRPGADPGAGPAGDVPGVVWWRPSTDAVVALDRLLAGATSVSDGAA